MNNSQITDTQNAVPAGAPTEEVAFEARSLTPGRMILKRFFRSKLSMFGVVTLCVLFAVSFFGPFFTGWGEGEVDRSGKVGNVNTRTFVGEDGKTYNYYDVEMQEVNRYAPVSSEHLLGTDEEGRDVLTRLMCGGRVSLTIGFVVVLVETLIGVLLGGLSGYFGGWVDNVIMRVVDVLTCLPSLPVLIIVGALLDSWNVSADLRIYYLMFALTLIGWTGIARLVRGQILFLREQEFMLAEESLGMPVRRKIFRHLVPNVMPQLIVSMTLGLGGVILMESTLSFLGLGMPYEKATWGSMISSATNTPLIMRDYPNLWVPAGILIVLAVLSFNFIGDGLRDAFDPKMKR